MKESMMLFLGIPRHALSVKKGTRYPKMTRDAYHITIVFQHERTRCHM